MEKSHIVIKEATKGMPLLGDRFPEMDVPTTHGKIKLPQDYNGKWFVLFSHPADFTPVCTTEFVAFQKRYKEFEALNCKLIGLSVDQVFSHIKWVDWIEEKLNVKIEFPVIAATETTANKLGLIHYGKGTDTVRAVFIVDPKGAVRATLYYPQELGRNIDEIVRMVKGLQISSQEGVAIPAGWPENELVDDHVIIPPAKDVETARKREKEYTCFDWWFCHKKR
ncbi:peroxiredoxin [Candidatus Acetothermia bacterium]|jgi:peroxiredoxin (alkyl hydroperoxide reductase subunit C)|nr:peroxiredoxin [Candidatus Acetothermia bacterium]MCI2426979.1 peroxiredoxin [Candidatus Acetothermia bacterium]MCI2428547.1 peroxiredoxin [Candidatus Acetothermia bacterium]